MKAAFESFQDELNRLVAAFEQGFQAFTAPDYSEARVREDFLNPLFRALGWDLANRRGLVQSQREVEIESRTDVAGRAKRADYLFRADGRERFVCEAKKPRETLGERYAFQAKRYAWNKGLPLAILTDFEDLKVYIVGGRPRPDRPDDGLWKTWNFRQFSLCAREIWDLLSRERVAAGSIEALLDSLPKARPVKGKARQPWLIRPERTKALDQDFLEYLDEQRLSLARDILANNTREDMLAEGRLNEAVQHILDRLLFLRICEDRDIDTGLRLAKIVETWRRAYGHEDRRRPKQGHFFREASAAYRAAPPAESLWAAVVGHLQALDRRPPGNMPHFNGNLFKPHFSEDLRVGDQWLCDFIEDLSDDESPYLFNVIPVEILGSVYERFLGKVIQPRGRGVAADEKPEVRKAGGVYYTPRYIVDYIVEQTVGKQLDEIAGVGRVGSTRRRDGGLGQAALPESPTYAVFDKKTRALKILDPACGSGSFLLRAFERVGEHYQRRFTEHPEDRKPDRCWTDPATGDVHLAVDLKRQILRNNIFGVDLDAQAVEVTQLSLYLKMLEGEDRQTIKQQRELFRDDTALLPPLENNIKHGNSLIASDFSLVPEDLMRVHAFDWDIQFAEIMKGGGFDAVIGNPPYVRMEEFAPIRKYLRSHYKAHEERADVYIYFLEKTLSLIGNTGLIAMIVSNKFTVAKYGQPLRSTIKNMGCVYEIADFAGARVFKGATVRTIVLVMGRNEKSPSSRTRYIPVPSAASFESIESGRLSVAQYANDAEQFLSPGQLTERPWALIPAGRADLLAKLSERFPDLVEAFGWKPLFGIKTGLNEAFVLDADARQHLLKTDRKNHEVIKPFLFGKDVKRYAIDDSGRHVIYFHNGGHPKEFPAVKTHLERFKSALNQRAAHQEWYELQQPAVALLPLLAKPKIVYPIIAPESRFALDDKGYLVNDKLFVLPTDSRFLLGLLNSKLGNFFFTSVCARLEGPGACYFEFRSQFVERFPVAGIRHSSPTDRARHDKLVELVDKMLVLVPKLRAEASESKRKTLQNAVDATDRQIDRLVYELYGLTGEEIALVEGGA
ncbi:MAG TPA: TaqI-like C-terminal specificity domain-containing protein [Kiritimatiellia bacterium]|nr:TaqI-like C-terminal specificity domain-containing protein [Kiritimatiellia bacterium]HRZ12313.1 TaqI-like C-terminal specificity domain-containing protein [Kiritimatiellia bacterium]HSA17929.1 TaqI-like C-terminal specificity domain-containing protein [Kiritimatiellia bacterium]